MDKESQAAAPRAATPASPSEPVSRREQDFLLDAVRDWQTTFDAISDLIMLLDPDHRVTRVNEAALSFFHLPLDEVLGKRCYELMHGTSAPPQLCPLAPPRGDGRAEETEIYDEARKKWFHVTADPILDGRGALIGYVHIIKDVTARLRAEREAQALRDQLFHAGRVSVMGELTASLAHELNQPLTAILSNAQAARRLLEAEAPDLAEIRDILKDIADDDQRAAGVIRRIRALLKKNELDLKPVDLNDAVGEVAGLLRGELLMKDVAVEFQLATQLPPVRADRPQLQQVILNLILNALDAMRNVAAAGRRLRISTTQGEAGFAQLAVADSGEGIPPERLDQIFRPFYTSKAEGMGMGLAICRSIVTAHGGRIWAANNANGPGAIFFVLLPIDPDTKP